MSKDLNKKDKALRWPVGILSGTVAIIALCVGTIIVAVNNPVQMDNDYNSKYRNIDKNINDIVEANIAFNKEYKLSYIANPLKEKQTRIAYSLINKDNLPILDANLTAVLTRPNETTHDMQLQFKSVGEGVYEAALIDLPLQGRWNLYATAKVGTLEGFLRLKLDTRYPKDILPFETIIPMN